MNEKRIITVYEFACLTVPAFSVGFSSRVLRGNESEGTSHLQVSWNVSGCVRVPTYYCIQPLMYEENVASNCTFKTTFSRKVASNNYNHSSAAVKGIDNKKIERCCNKGCHILFVLFHAGEDFVGDPIFFSIHTEESSSKSGETGINCSLLIDDDRFEPKIEEFFLLIMVDEKTTSTPLAVSSLANPALFQILDNEDSKFNSFPMSYLHLTLFCVITFILHE